MLRLNNILLCVWLFIGLNFGMENSNQSDVKTANFEKLTNEEIETLASMTKDELYDTIQEIHQERMELTVKLAQLSTVKTRMDWFDNLDQRDKDNAVELLTQGIKHYNDLNQDVLIDMNTKFGIIPAQTQQLYKFLYSKENKIDEDSTTNIYDKVEENLNLPDEECMVCYEYFPAVFQFSCGHEVCSLCAESIMNKCSNTNCPKCRKPLAPRLLKDWIILLKIYPIALTPDIPLEKLQRAFPLICCGGNLTTVTKCVELGVDVDTEGFSRYFPLHLSSKKDVVKYLIDKGANMNQVHDNGATPFVMSCERGLLPVVEYLMNNGADVNKTNNDGWTGLLRSSQHGHLAVVEFLINNRANVNEVTHDGYNPLYISSAHDHLSVVEFLINNGANVNQATNDGVTPLYISSQLGYLSIVEYLINNGADVNQATNKGATPLTIAIPKNHTEIAKLLLRKDANIETAKLFLQEKQKFAMIEILDKLCKEIQ